jgi:hypothetical protein
MATERTYCTYIYIYIYIYIEREQGNPTNQENTPPSPQTRKTHPKPKNVENCASSFARKCSPYEASEGQLHEIALRRVITKLAQAPHTFL